MGAVGDIVADADWALGCLLSGARTPLGKTGDLEPDESVDLDLSFLCEELKLVNDTGGEVVLAGSFAITVFDGTTSLPPFTVTISESRVVSELPPPSEQLRPTGTSL